MPAIDLNSDLGEGYGAWSMGDDAQMLSIVSSANIACGFHAGDPAGLLRCLRIAAERGVSVGAHVSYPDRVGFGRRNMDISEDDLVADIVYQIGALSGLARAAGTRVRYVKPHGALYNTIAQGGKQGEAVIKAIGQCDKSLALMTLVGAPLVKMAQEAGLTTIAEAFADRAYMPDGQLVDRRQKGAVLHDPAEVAERMVLLAQTGTIKAIDGSLISLEAQSICVHGDSPGAVDMARAVRQRLEASGIDIRAFAG